LEFSSCRWADEEFDLASLAGADPSGWDLRRDARPGIDEGFPRERT